MWHCTATGPVSMKIKVGMKHNTHFWLNFNSFLILIRYLIKYYRFRSLYLVSDWYSLIHVYLLRFVIAAIVITDLALLFFHNLITHTHSMSFTNNVHNGLTSRGVPASGGVLCSVQVAVVRCINILLTMKSTACHYLHCMLTQLQLIIKAFAADFQWRSNGKPRAIPQFTKKVVCSIGTPVDSHTPL